MRAVLAGGREPGNMEDNRIYSNYAHTGNAVDFGDLNGDRAFNCAGASNGHGGLLITKSQDTAE